MAIRLLIFSENQDQNTSWIKNRTYAGMIRRLVTKVSKPSVFKLRVKYAETGFVGISIVKLIMYKGQRLYSISEAHINLRVSP